MKQYLIRSIVDGQTMHSSEKLSYLQKHIFLIFSVVLAVMISFALVHTQTLFAQGKPTFQEFPVENGSLAHDVAPDPAKDGPVWFTAEDTGNLGKLDPTTGKFHLISLGKKAHPHGVILGPDGVPWITDGGLNAIVRVDPKTEEVKVFPLPENITKKYKYSLLNTPTVDKNGMVWFTGRAGFYGKLNPETGVFDIYLAPRGRGPYGITTSPDGSVYFNSWNGNYTGRIDPQTGKLTILEPPTKGPMNRRVWSDSQGHVWVSEWAAKNLASYDPTTNKWKEWRVPGDSPIPYGIYVDEKDMVWITNWAVENGTQTLLRFDPTQEKFEAFPLPSDHSDIHQLNGRPGEVWAAEAGIDKILLIRTGD
jgi:virginiamycin B lyase